MYRLCVCELLFFTLFKVSSLHEIDYSDCGIGNAILIIIQLLWAGIMVICLDEMLQKGYGLGTRISLIVAILF